MPAHRAPTPHVALRSTLPPPPEAPPEWDPEPWRTVPFDLYPLWGDALRKAGFVPIEREYPAVTELLPPDTHLHRYA